MFKLIIEDDEGKTTVVPLIRDEITIGRKDGNTIRLTERNVSRRHARLTKINGQIFVEDLNSYNGVKVNGERIHGRFPVREGDAIEVGDYQLALKVDQGAELLEGQVPPPESSTAVIRVDDIKPPAKESSDEIEAVPVEHVCKLVVLNTKNLKGREFVLSANDMVIGRADSCDITIDHRSISRKHARLIWDGTSYIVVDLNSANGVRVNDEEYGRVEVNKNDLLELGHVKFRFVGQEENAEPLPPGAEERAPKKPQTALLAVAGVALVLVIVLIWAVLSRTKETGPGEEKSLKAAVASTTPVEGDKVNITDIETALTEKKWEEAVKLCSAYKVEHPDDPRGDEYLRKAQYEHKNYQKFANIQSAQSLEEYEKALMLCNEFPKDSVYYEMVKTTQADVKRNYFRKHLEAGEHALTEGDCKLALKESQSILVMDEGHPEAKKLQHQAEKCERKKKTKQGGKERYKVKEPTEKKDSSGTPHETGGTKEKGATKERKAQAKELFIQGRGKFITGDFASAKKLLGQAIKLKPKFAEPYKILGMIYGRQGNVKKMVEAYRMFMRLKPRDPINHQLKKIIDSYYQKNTGAEKNK